MKNELYESTYYYRMDRFDVRVKYCDRMDVWYCGLVKNEKEFLELDVYHSKALAIKWFSDKVAGLKFMGAA